MCSQVCKCHACRTEVGVAEIKVLQFEQPMVPALCRMTGPLLIPVEKILLSSDLHGGSLTSWTSRCIVNAPIL